MFNKIKKDITIYAVHSYEELQQIIRQVEGFGVRKFIKRVFITYWVLAANILLTIIRRLYFKSKLSHSEVKEIVVYTVGILGDNAVILPALATLRWHFSTATITIITNCQHWNPSATEGILTHSPFKDRLIILNDHPVQRDGFQFIWDKDKYVGVGCDLFVNLSPFGNRGWLGAVLKEIVFARFLGAHYAVGFRMSTLSRGSMFHLVQYHFVKNEPRRAAAVLEELGIKKISEENPLPIVREAQAAISGKLKKLGVNRPYFIINPGAKFHSKCWPLEQFGAVACYLFKKYGSVSVITGVASEKDIADKVVAASKRSAISLAGETTVVELIELLRHSSGCITNDTGTMHLAALLNIPTVALFSARLTPAHWMPEGERIISLFTLPDCRYCYNDGCIEPICLNAIEVNSVVESLDHLISASCVLNA